MKQFEQGEFRKFWLTIFVTIANVAIIVVAMTAPNENGLNYAAFTAAVGFEGLMIQYYYRSKTPIVDAAEKDALITRLRKKIEILNEATGREGGNIEPT